MLAERFADGARESGHDVGIIDAAHADVSPCTGCVCCGYSGPCVQKDDMGAIRGRSWERTSGATTSSRSERRPGGTPWPPAVLTFMEGVDWAGKTVVPFMTNGGWPGHVIEDMTKACSGADVRPPMGIRFDSDGGDRLETPQNEIGEWVESVVALLRRENPGR